MSRTPLERDAQKLIITTEDEKRARDRRRVRILRSRQGRGGSLWLLWLLIGPGILVMLGENDGPV